MDNKKRKHIYFSGRVQGGFRYMAMHFGRSLRTYRLG